MRLVYIPIGFEPEQYKDLQKLKKKGSIRNISHYVRSVVSVALADGIRVKK